MSDPLKDIMDYQARKYAAFKEKQDQEQQEKENKIKLENEMALLKEIQFREEFDAFMSKMDNYLIQIQMASNILEIDSHLLAIYSLLEANNKYINDTVSFKEIYGKVIDIINNISMNENSRFNVNVSNDNLVASKRITDSIKLICDIINMNYDDLMVDMMDTSKDIELANKLQNEENNMNNYDFNGYDKNYRCDFPMPKNTKPPRKYSNDHSQFNEIVHFDQFEYNPYDEFTENNTFHDDFADIDALQMSQWQTDFND